LFVFLRNFALLCAFLYAAFHCEINYIYCNLLYLGTTCVNE